MAGRWVTTSCLPREKLDRFAQELKTIEVVAADYATFSGMGELGEAPNLGEAIQQKIVTSCAGCSRSFKNEYPRLLGRDIGIEVFHLPQFVAKLIDAGKLKSTRPGELGLFTVPLEVNKEVLFELSVSG